MAKKICGTQVDRKITQHIIRALKEKVAHYDKPKGYAWIGWTIDQIKSLESGGYKIIEETHEETEQQ
jgi:hypothetical protein